MLCVDGVVVVVVVVVIVEDEKKVHDKFGVETHVAV